MALNTSMFEQNGQSGFVLKPAVMWDKSHMMYNHFNPMDKEFDGLHATVLTLQVRASSINILKNQSTESTFSMHKISVTHYRVLCVDFSEIYI